ncbi:DUF4236 domain-containing protein [Promicromonospora soli]
MGFVARKSFKLAPGVRMTVSKSGVSASVGVRGARISKSTSGRTTASAGIPGSGIYYTKSHTSGSKAQRSRQGAQPARVEPAAPARPGLFAPKWEKELYKAIASGRLDRLGEIAQAYPESMPVAVTLDALSAMGRGASDRALALCRAAWRTPDEEPIENHPFVRKYLAPSEFTINVAEGVAATLPISRDAVGLALAELEQLSGNVDAAMGVVEQLDPSAVAAVSLSELYIEVGRYDDVIDVTNGIANDDDPTALLNAYRGIAFREQGHHTAAREAFKEALKSKSRDAGIRHFAMVERAKTYIAEGKWAMARKDLERVLMENANYRGVRELLAGGETISAEVVEAGSLKSTAPTATDVEPELAEVAQVTPAPVAAPPPPTASASTPDAAEPVGGPSIESNVSPRDPAPLPDLEGYGVHVSFDGDLLRLVATSKVSAFALLGPDHREGQVQVYRGQIAGIKFTTPGRLVNGRLDIYTRSGARHQVHFLWKQRAQPWRELAEMLVAPSR